MSPPTQPGIYWKTPKEPRDSRTGRVRQAKPHSPVTTHTVDWFVYILVVTFLMDFRKNLPSDDMIMIKSFAQLKISETITIQYNYKINKACAEKQHSIYGKRKCPTHSRQTAKTTLRLIKICLLYTSPRPRDS